MKSYIKRALIIIGIFAGIMVTESYAKVRTIESTRDFEQRVGQRGVCVALFYTAAAKNDKDMNEKNKRLFRMFDDVSDDRAYEKADVICVKVNLARNEFSNFMQQYQVTAMPVFMLFKDGKQLRNRQGYPIALTGFITQQSLKEFIDTYCGMQIDAINVAKDKERNVRLQEENQSWRPYFYPRDMVVEGYSPDEARSNLE